METEITFLTYQSFGDVW